ncbi:MAG: hypothetical protein PVF63_03825, partial [Gammaproteobacteria bacterium]
MRHVVVSALVAAVVTGIVLALFPSGSADDSMDVTTIPAAPPAGLRLTVSDALPEDVWLDGAR